MEPAAATSNNPRDTALDRKGGKWVEIGFLIATIVTFVASAWTGVAMLFILDGSDSGGPGLLHGGDGWGDVGTMAMMLAVPAAVLFSMSRRYRSESLVFAVAWTLAFALWAWVLALLITTLFGSGQ